MRVTGSEAISEIEYHAKKRQLYVRFTSRAPYLYFDVPAQEAASFAEADSKGRYFAEHIRDRYRYRKLDA